ncbi:hypothetical protein BBJ28_00012026 [Nothophytophthora sp. Chile5]|nr:hypothetical protein BBJ28_00012026 [Nothophytophthora sp. Chile5]
MTGQRQRHGARRPAKALPQRTDAAPTNWEKARGSQRKHQHRTTKACSGKSAPGSAKKVSARTAAVQLRTGNRGPRQRRNKEGDAVKRTASSSPGFPRRHKPGTAPVAKETPSALELEEAATLNEELTAFATFVALSPQERAFRKRMFEDVRELIGSAFEDATVQLYGSSSTGLDTFRSDLDITVGNITLSSSQRLPGRMVSRNENNECGHTVSGLEQQQEEEEEENEDDHKQLEELSDPEGEEAETSFSLNLALPAGTAASLANQDIPRRVLPTTHKSHWNPTLRRRKIRVLRALQFLLQSQRPHFQIKCLHKAKTPILMVLDTKSHLAMDIGVNREAFECSDHGRSTSLAHKLLQTLGAPFTTMVAFLKEFLHQFELDKPFTGGLGSFRLYMMVAYVFHRADSKNKTKRQPPVSALLLMFFELFGNKKLPNFLHERTQLPLPFEDESHLDFGGVFRLADCVDTFAMAFDILSSTGKLGSIIYEERLEQDREKSRKAIRQHV